MAAHRSATVHCTSQNPPRVNTAADDSSVSILCASSIIRVLLAGVLLGSVVQKHNSCRVTPHWADIHAPDCSDAPYFPRVPAPRTCPDTSSAVFRGHPRCFTGFLSQVPPGRRRDDILQQAKHLYFDLQKCYGVNLGTLITLVFGMGFFFS